MNGGGGYTGGNRQVSPDGPMVNGLAGSSKYTSTTSSFDGVGGSGYFQASDDFPNKRDFAGPLGGRWRLDKLIKFKFLF